MSFVILAIRPHHPVTRVTTRPTERMARSVANGFELAFQGQCTTKIVISGTVYCSECGKCDNWNAPESCKRPIGEAEEWACEMGLSGFAKGVIAP